MCQIAFLSGNRLKVKVKFTFRHHLHVTGNTFSWQATVAVATWKNTAQSKMAMSHLQGHSIIVHRVNPDQCEFVFLNKDPIQFDKSATNHTKIIALCKWK